jgi:hypothetical protein
VTGERLSLEIAMGTNGNSAEKTADERHDEFAQDNKAWDKRIRDAVSELDKVVGATERAVGSERRTAA